MTSRPEKLRLLKKPKVIDVEPKPPRIIEIKPSIRVRQLIERTLASMFAAITGRCLCRWFAKVVARCAECNRPICENHWWVAGRPYCTRCGYRLFLSHDPKNRLEVRRR
jgi:DNA-directed RNA polymerase subunit RPC12/RpoP